MIAKCLFTGVLLAALAGCTGTSPSRNATADVAGCYRGTGLERTLGPTARPGADSAAEASARPTLVLDSVVEPGGKQRHARMALGARAWAGEWEPAGGDTLTVTMTGAYPWSAFTLRHEGRKLEGTAQHISMLPDATVDTTSWDVRLTSTACTPALAELPTAGTSRPPFPPSLRTELVVMGDSDQAVRHGLTAESIKDTAVVHRMARTDSANTARLREIIRRWGWPDGSRAGEAASHAAFTVLQHTPSDSFRERMLPRLDTLARVGEVSGPDVALLTDRVLDHQGLPQRYGSQFNFKDGAAVPDPIEDSANVDARRAAMGLMPLALYARMLRQMYHASAEPKAGRGTGGS